MIFMFRWSAAECDIITFWNVAFRNTSGGCVTSIKIGHINTDSHSGFSSQSASRFQVCVCVGGEFHLIVPYFAFSNFSFSAFRNVSMMLPEGWYVETTASGKTTWINMHEPPRDPHIVMFYRWGHLRQTWWHETFGELDLIEQNRQIVLALWFWRA